MISYLVTPEHRYTIDVYLGEWGRALRSRMRVLPYTRLAYQRRFARGTYLFSDLERLSAVELAAAAALADALLAAGALVLNHRPASCGATHCCARSTTRESTASTPTPSSVATRCASPPSCASTMSTLAA
jgi:hypothetical protein